MKLRAKGMKVDDSLERFYIRLAERYTIRDPLSNQEEIYREYLAFDEVGEISVVEPKSNDMGISLFDSNLSPKTLLSVI